jgi:hypothetical protein
MQKLKSTNGSHLDKGKARLCGGNEINYHLVSRGPSQNS